MVSEKRRRYGKSRARRRRGLLLVLVVIAGLVALPFVLGVPGAIREAIYPLRY